jgi:hypothetical protein
VNLRRLKGTHHFPYRVIRLSCSSDQERLLGRLETALYQQHLREPIPALSRTLAEPTWRMLG